MPTPPASARPASRSPARSPAAAANSAKSQRRTRRTSKELMLAKVDELRTMIEDHCDAGAPKTSKTAGAAKPRSKSQTRRANSIPTLMPGTLATPAALAASKPSTMVPLSLPAAAVAATPSIASAVASAAVPSKRKGAPRPMQSRTQEGSYQWFIDDWVKKNPELAAGKTRPQLMALAEMKRNYKIYKNSKGSAGPAAAAAAAAGPAALSAVVEESRARTPNEEEEEENLGLL